MKCPLTGKICLLPKEIQITEINDGITTTMHLCHQCGEQYLKTPEAEVTSKITELNSTGIKEEIKSGVACPSCGATMQDLIKSKRIGCAKCWEFFKELLPITMLSQGALPDQNLEHVGKIPKNNKEMQIKHLERQMQEAIKKEDYEEAARLRDEIKELDKTE